MLNIKYNSLNEAIITINKVDYDKVIDNKTIYDVDIVSYKGMIKFKKLVSVYKYILLFIIFAFITIYILSNFIFRIDVVTNDNVMKEKIIKYLNKEGIKKYHLKKNYNELKRIKEGLLNKYKNEIDWAEIEVIGSKYIVRFEPRLNTDFKRKNKFQNVIATKNAIIYNMDIKSGQIIKNRFDYVKKGDVIVSGYIYLNDKIMNTVKALGVVYGETWYKVNINYPYKCESKRKTGNKKKVLSINFLNKDIDIFNFNKYSNYEKKSNILFKNNILPISVSLDVQSELLVKKESNNYNEAVHKAVKLATKKIKKKLDDNSYIKDHKILKTTKDKDGVMVSVFFSVIEKISGYQEIEEYKEENDEQS